MHITVGPRQSVTAGHSPVRSLFIPDLQWNEFPRPPQSGATRDRLPAPTASVAMPWPPDLRFWFWKMFLQFPCFPSLSPHAVRFRREAMEPLDEETWLPEWQREGNKSPPPPRGVTLNSDVGKESTIMTIIRRDQSLRLLAQLCSRWDQSRIRTNPSDHTLLNNGFPVFDSLVVPK